ncbi:hypothetical protein [Paracoccus albus]|uniref:hypothetical protein n=1 Tax=Paracoccus albus TaxID=3017784 RepID=UPI0022F10349|nr:hypothetical protein [Paracoccus albus]WBU59641.1 hypothetical protein PAF20_12870 [Paracoccus albus]WBU59649.1 hypothetical protein PAF20_12920 [Paracoccus albus]
MAGAKTAAFSPTASPNLRPTTRMCAPSPKTRAIGSKAFQKCGERANPAIRAKARALVSLAYGATLMRKSGMDKAEAGTLLKTGEALLD